MQSVWLKAEESEADSPVLVTGNCQKRDSAAPCLHLNSQKKESCKRATQGLNTHTGRKAKCWLQSLELKSDTPISYSDEVCRNHHQGLPHYPSLHTWCYIIRIQSCGGMDWGLYMLGTNQWRRWLWQLKCGLQDTLERLLQGGSISTKNCTAELSCARNPKIICLNSPGHCTHTNLLLYFWARIANCTSLFSVKFSTWNITGK